MGRGRGPGFRPYSKLLFDRPAAEAGRPGRIAGAWRPSRAGEMSPPLEAARALDAADPLRGFKSRFVLPPGVIYLDGNSLGPMPLAARTKLAAVADHEWGEGLIRSWNDPAWIGAPAPVGPKIAPLIGPPP